MNLHQIFTRALVFVFLFTAFGYVQAQAQKGKKKKSKTEEAAKKGKAVAGKTKSFAQLTKGSKEIKGLFPIYQDTVTGSLQLVINEDQLNQEYIYFSQISNGIADLWMVRGVYNSSKVFKVEKYFDRIEFVTQNTTSYFDPDNALSKASEANLSRGIMASLKILAYDKKNKRYLIKGDDLFLKETFSQIKPSSKPGKNPKAFTLGSLDKDKSKVVAINNYPENTNLEIEYVYSKSSTSNGGSRMVTDGRNVSIKVYHSIMQMPDDGYEPRFDDARVGYFIDKVTDMTSKSATPYRDLIHRWRLIKKDSTAELSEPVKPIVWWIENTTPKEIRPIIKRAGLKWNIAFEKAGFKNAIVIKEQPDTAKWDAGDIRYNVLRWTATADPLFGGYGPSFVNPRTGEILGADIMLEYASLASRLRTEKIFRQGFSDLDAKEEENRIHDHLYCTAGMSTYEDNILGMMAIKALGGDALDKSKMVEEYLHFLIIHEMGHTLGLNHNMKSSQLHAMADIHNIELTEKVGLTGSVMDYPAINVSLDTAIQGNYWTKTVGPYDLWAIEFGYKPVESEEELDKILARSTEHDLMFGNDADDMRSPGKAIDPRVNVNDMTSDAIAFASQQIETSNIVAGKILAQAVEGNSYHEIRNAYNLMIRQTASAGNTMSRYIGGIYVDRSVVGQKGATKPFIPVEKARQKEAMDGLSKYIFSKDVAKYPSELYNYLQKQRRGFDHKTPEDPKLHAQISSMQGNVLSHLLHVNTLNRIVDTEKYGNEYDIATFMSDLTNSIFKDDIYGDVTSVRQNLQLKYAERLISILNGGGKSSYMPVVRSMCLHQIKNIRKMSSNATGNTSSRAHKGHLKTLIDNAVKEIK